MKRCTCSFVRSLYLRLQRVGTVLLALIALAILPMPTLAQSATTTLTVQVRDTADRPLAEIAVRVVGASSREPLGQATTNANGLAIFDAIPASEVRVVLEGTLPSGTALTLIGQDATGIYANLSTSSWLMDLRVDEDGSVFPDLGLNSAGAADGDDHAAIMVGTIPAAMAQTDPNPTERVSVTTESAAGYAEPATDVQVSRVEIFMSLLLALILITSLGALVVFGRRI